jgi:outer membrane lipoprotein SlyB
VQTTLVRFAFFATLFWAPNFALADEWGVAAGAVTGGVAGAVVGGPIGAIVGAGIGGVAGGAVTGPAAVKIEQPPTVMRGSVEEMTCVEDASGNRTCRNRRVQ